MSPERIRKTNMWRLFKDEYVAGLGGVIKGPRIVYVNQFGEEERLVVESLKVERKVLIEGTDFTAKVKSTKQR